MNIESLGSLLATSGHADALQRKEVINISGNASAWYQSNGYYQLAEAHSAGRGSQTGITVSPSAAMRNTAFFACTKIISEDVASLPLFLYERTRNGNGREKATSEPLYRVIHDTPNSETSAIDLRGSMTAHAAVGGDGYSRIIRRASDGKVIAWWLLQPESVRCEKDSKGRTLYIHKDGNSAEKTYQVRDILHLRGFGWDGKNGYDVVKQFRDVIGLGLSAESYAAQFFSRDSTPGVVLKTPKSLAPEEVKNIKAAWNASHQGASHEVTIVHGGLEVERISFNPEETQLIAQRVYQLLEVCRIFRMPPHKLAELSRATFSNIEQQSIDYYSNTLRPWLIRWEQAIGRCCLTMEESLTLYAEHSIEGLLRGDFKTQTDGFTKLLQNGVYSINEVRGFYNLNPIEDGDSHFLQLNMQSVVNAAQAIDENGGVVDDTTPSDSRNTSKAL